MNNNHVDSSSDLVWNRNPDDQPFSGPLITVPASALYLTKGDIYTPSIVVVGCSRELALSIGDGCLIFQKFKQRICPIISHPDNIIIEDSCVYLSSTIQVKKLHFKIRVDDAFINGQNNMSIAFIDSTERTTYNTCGFIHFESQRTPNYIDSVDDINSGNSTHCICTVNGGTNQTEVTEVPPQKPSIITKVEEHSNSVSNLLYIPHVYVTFMLIILLFT